MVASSETTRSIYFSKNGASNFGSGAMEDFRVYDSALDVNEIQKLYRDSRNATLSSGLVAAYAFDEGSGTTVADASGKRNNGTIANARWIKDGKYGSALVFNGANSLVSVADSTSLH